MPLLCNDVSHWLGTSLESALRSAGYKSGLLGFLRNKMKCNAGFQATFVPIEIKLGWAQPETKTWMCETRPCLGPQLSWTHKLAQSWALPQKSVSTLFWKEKKNYFLIKRYYSTELVKEAPDITCTSIMISKLLTWSLKGQQSLGQRGLLWQREEVHVLDDLVNMSNDSAALASVEIMVQLLIMCSSFCSGWL